MTCLDKEAIFQIKMNVKLNLYENWVLSSYSTEVKYEEKKDASTVHFSNTSA